METYIQIAYLNDFIFCPLSIYFHQLYGKLTPDLYHELAQVRGKQVHEAIETGHYSTRRKVLQGMEVYSDRYNLCGKIDIFDVEKGLLTERKKKIIRIYDGYIFQLYAQYYCLTEMEYEVKELRFYSSDDNTAYPVRLPEEDTEMKDSFEKTVAAISDFDLEAYQQMNAEKCYRCVYEPLCDRSLL